MTTHEKVTRIICDYIGEDSLFSNDLHELGLDSLGSLDLANMLEEELGIILDKDNWEDVKTIEDIVAAVDKASK